MYKELIEIIKNVCLRYKGAKTFKYQDVFLNNAQNNHATLQFYLSDMTHHDLNISYNPPIFKMEAMLYILDHPSKEEDSILDCQDRCYDAALNIIAKLDNLEEYQGIIRVHDYSITTLSHYSDDDSAGVRTSIVLDIPVAVDLCSYEDNFNDEPYTPEPEKEITIKEKETPELTLKKTKLPKNKSNC